MRRRWMRPTMCVGVVLSIMALVGSAGWGYAQESDQAADLAKKLANPVADLISVPIQYNYDSNYGLTDEGVRNFANIQPVIPIGLGENWNVITRTIVPVIWQSDMSVPGKSESGLGDIVASQFFSPKAPVGGWIVGVGPAWLLPTASDETLGSEKWGVGPTAVALKQQGGWTFGLLTQQMWSFAGDDDRADVNAMFLQPFMVYLITKTMTSLSANTETTYDWENETWSVPIHAAVNQMFKIGKLPLQLTAAARYWADSPDYGPEGWGFRAQLTFIFPK